MTKLLETTTGELVEIPASDVLAARKSGRFGFPLDRPVPIIQNGEPKWIPAKLADQYRSSLTFTDDNTVYEYNAKERMSGIGGVLAGTAYGAAKGLTLGFSPLLMKAVGQGDLARDIELGAGTSSTIAELGTLGFGPGLFLKAAKGGKEAAAAAGIVEKAIAGAEKTVAKEGAAAVGLATEAGVAPRARRTVADWTEAETRAWEAQYGRGGSLQSPPVSASVGKGAASEVLPAVKPGSASSLAVDKAAAAPLADSRGLSEPMVATAPGPTSPIGRRPGTPKLEPFENPNLAGPALPPAAPAAAKMPTNEALLAWSLEQRADYLTQITELEGRIARMRGPNSIAKTQQELDYLKMGVLEEDATASKLREAIEAAAPRGAVPVASGVADTSIGKTLRNEKAAARAGTDVRQRLLPAHQGGQGVTKGRELVLGQPRPGVADVLRAEQALGAEAKSMASLGARNAEAAAAETAAWLGEDGTRAATQAELDIVAGVRVAPGRELAIAADVAELDAAAGAGVPPRARRTVTPPTEEEMRVRLSKWNALNGRGKALVPPPGVAPAPAAATTGTGLTLGAPRASGLSESAARGLDMVAEGAIYGGASQASREQLGLEEGAPGSVMKAALLGGGLSGAIHLGLNAASRGSLSLGGAGPGGAIGRALKSLEDTHIMRGLGNTAADVKSMNLRLKNSASGEVGSHFYVDEVKKAFANMADLQRQFPDDAILQSIPLDGKWSSMTAERKMAFTDAFKASLGPRYDAALTHINSIGIDETAVEAIVKAAESRAAKGLEKTSLESVNKALADIKQGLKTATKPFRDAADAAEQGLSEMASAEERLAVRNQAYAEAKAEAPLPYTVKDINRIKTELGRAFDDWSSRHGGEWTPVQSGVYSDFKNIVYGEATKYAKSSGTPIDAQLTELDKLFMVAATMSKGVANDAAKKALQSPVGRDLLAQFALGAFAIGNPIGAALFAVGAAGLRGIYNSRGEGFIADMAAKLSRGIVANPQAAGAVAAQSIYSARRVAVLGSNGERLVDSEPKDYSAMVKSVRELNESRESVIADMRSKTSGLSPSEQTAAVNGLDKMMNDLAANVPPGLSVPGQLSQQQKNYVVYAKSMMSPAYALQVIVNGGTGGAAAAKALSDLGANGEGKAFLDSLAAELKKHVDESDDRKTADNAAAAYAAIAKMTKSTTIGRVHSRGGLSMPRPKLMSGPKAPIIKAGAANRFVAGAATVK